MYACSLVCKAAPPCLAAKVIDTALGRVLLQSRYEWQTAIQVVSFSEGNYSPKAFLVFLFYLILYND